MYEWVGQSLHDIPLGINISKYKLWLQYIPPWNNVSWFYYYSTHLEQISSFWCYSYSFIIVLNVDFQYKTYTGIANQPRQIVSILMVMEPVWRSDKLYSTCRFHVVMIDKHNSLVLYTCTCMHTHTRSRLVQRILCHTAYVYVMPSGNWNYNATQHVLVFSAMLRTSSPSWKCCYQCFDCWFFQIQHSWL